MHETTDATHKITFTLINIPLNKTILHILYELLSTRSNCCKWRNNCEIITQIHWRQHLLNCTDYANSIELHHSNYAAVVQNTKRTITEISPPSSFLQRGRIACNAERCNTYSNSVCLSVRLSHAGTLSRRMNIGLRGLHCEVAKTL